MPPLKGYTFGMRLKDNIPKSSSTPSPLDYSTSCLTRFGKLSSPAYSIKSKGPPKDHRSLTPSPLDYQSINIAKLKSTKSYSFGFGKRTAFVIKSETPSPNIYTVPTTIGNNVPDKKKTGRAFSMQGRRKHSIEKSTTPGPGAYETVNIDLYKKKEPAIPFTGHRQSPFTPADPHLPGPISEFLERKPEFQLVRNSPHGFVLPGENVQDLDEISDNLILAKENSGGDSLRASRLINGF